MNALTSGKDSLNLNEETRKQGLYILGEVYSLHITDDDTVVITDFYDYSIVYVVMSLDMYNAISASSRED